MFSAAVSYYQNFNHTLTNRYECYLSCLKTSSIMHLDVTNLLMPIKLSQSVKSLAETLWLRRKVKEGSTNLM
ncbi:hypothetical protein [Thermoleptolyngbya sp. C42_A2020_037]|uniref:hypothetical protein n=1 Tax=Thermoleptolyngbya sp. C42_A2020_037 TaxID=2747799 RepID=UPI001A1004ED|nr:hypothetical protein [Thermoleptolyngbya sp. C42_A2020_037]MBF2084599.1 hypothetical protein [Thermoleptolyngbya sp. C42_A2020_037]